VAKPLFAATLCAGALYVALILLSPDTRESDNTLPFYERMVAGMSVPGMVLHTTSIVYSCERTDVWIDTSIGAALEEFRYECDEKDEIELRTLRRDGLVWYARPQTQPSRGRESCSGANAAVLALFTRCSPSPEPRFQVLHGHLFEGRATIALRATGEYWGIDSRVEYDEYLYIDEDTGLPIARVNNIRDFYGGAAPPVTERIVERYSHEFVQRETLSADLFQPFPGAEPFE
jgi:hypothetical protein